MDAAGHKRERAEQEQEPAPNAADVHDRRIHIAVDAFESMLELNRKHRMAHPEDAALFVDSELALHAEVQGLRALAGEPDLYPSLLRRGLHISLCKLLAHDNPDLAAAGASLIHQLMNSDGPPGLKAAKFLADALLHASVLNRIVHNLFRFSDEAEAVHHSLVLLETFFELRPFLAESVCENTDILGWLGPRVKGPHFEENKWHASEILTILLSSPANQKIFGQMDGVAILLQGIAMYKSRDPESIDEEEMLQNLFNCLCCVLMPVENKETFVKAEGVELMIIIMKQKKSTYNSAIRTLDFAMTRFPPACERFVDVLGLKTVFAAFMVKIPVNKKNKEKSYQEDLLEHAISIIASLFGGITQETRRIRLLGKFVENECEKIDRLMELYTWYSDRVKAETERFESLDSDELKYNRKLQAGLYTLQLLALIVGHIWVSGNSQMRTRIELLLRQNKLTKDDVKDILQEYHNSIGDLDGPEEKKKTQGQIMQIIASV